MWEGAVRCFEVWACWQRTFLLVQGTDLHIKVFSVQSITSGHLGFLQVFLN